VGEVMTVKLAAGQTASDVNAKRLESAFGLRPGAVKVQTDKASARRVHVHVAEVDPWEQDLAHPALTLLQTLTPANDPSH
jgi:hypothetical protein